MKKEQLFETLKEGINNELAVNIENLYDCELTTEARTIISNTDKVFHGDNWILLDYETIIDASNEMYIDFKELKMFPVIDLFDNDYLCFDYDNKEWVYFDLNDEMKYSTYKNLEDAFKENKLV